MVTVAEPAAYKSISAVCGDAMDHDDALAYTKALTSYFTGDKNKDVILSNASEDSTAAVNELLKAGKTVGMVTSGDHMGDSSAPTPTIRPSRASICSLPRASTRRA